MDKLCICKGAGWLGNGCGVYDEVVIPYQINKKIMQTENENTILKGINSVYRGIKSGCAWLIFFVFIIVMYAIVSTAMCSGNDKIESKIEIESEKTK